MASPNIDNTQAAYAELKATMVKELEALTFSSAEFERLQAYLQYVIAGIHTFDLTPKVAFTAVRKVLDMIATMEAAMAQDGLRLTDTKDSDGNVITGRLS